MIPEIGNVALLLAFCFALLQGLTLRDGKYPLWKMSAIGQFLFLSLAMLCLIASFINNDFTVIYVRDHSHQLLPLIYRIGAAWGGHEGSMLLWCCILSGWTFVFLLVTENDIAAPVVRVLAWLSTGFIAFLYLTSSPFQRNFPTELISGHDLTPILQDPGLLFHPPMLYLGYVGFAIPFAFAIAALLQGKIDVAAARACKPWVLLPWGFLSCGIVLGSWWAYRELGWGGWWFWDPVENASLLPWLAGTALIHSLSVVEKRDAFKGWTLLLAIITFALSLIGTFLVRSGVLVSVHAFANDPTRGLVLLSYLTFIIGGAFLLYGLRVKEVYHPPRFQFFSRETFLLINTLVLLTAIFTILLGTLYPIILDACCQEKLSVGEPYFNTVFIPIMLPTLLLMGLAPYMHWQQQKCVSLCRKVWLPLSVSIIIGCSIPLLWGKPFYWLTTIGICFAIWIIIATLYYVYQAGKLNLQLAAMVVAHISIAMIALAITVNKSYSEERQVKLFPGDSVTIANYLVQFKQITKAQGANFQTTEALFVVDHQFNITAEQRTYTSHQDNLSKPGIDYNLGRDLYIALGKSLPDGGWVVRIYYKPLVRWIWIGGFLLLISAGFSLLYSIRQKKQTRGNHAR